MAAVRASRGIATRRVLQYFFATFPPFFLWQHAAVG